MKTLNPKNSRPAPSSTKIPEASPEEQKPGLGKKADPLALARFDGEGGAMKPVHAHEEVGEGESPDRDDDPRQADANEKEEREALAQLRGAKPYGKVGRGGQINGRPTI